MTAGQMRTALADFDDGVEVRVYRNGQIRDAEFEIDEVDWDRQDGVLLIQVSKERGPGEGAE